MGSGQGLGHSRDSCTSCARQRRLQYPTAGRGQTRLSFLPLRFLLFRTLQRALSGGVRGGGCGEEEREGPPRGTPFLSDSSPRYRPDCESETKQQQEGNLLCVGSVCLLCLLEGSLRGLNNARPPLATRCTISTRRPLLVIQTLEQLRNEQLQDKSQLSQVLVR